MSDLTTPLKWTRPRDSASPGGEADTVPSLFRWPGPPLPGYPADIEQAPSTACEFVGGRNGKRVTGRLIFFVPDERVAHVQLPPARTTMALRFEQFQSMTIEEPLAPLQPPEGAAPRSRYRLHLKDGHELQGETVGHVESAYGLFLFPPHGDAGAVRRMFVPREVYDTCKIETAGGSAAAARAAVAPAPAASPAPGAGLSPPAPAAELLRSRSVETPEQLVQAIAQQARMPLIRIGEALLSLGMVTQQQLDEALVQQRRDRGTPLGELLVRMRAVSREDLQLALASKMGYPVVNLHKFTPDAEALRRLPFAIAQRLRVMPLMLHDGRLVVALDDPSRRRAAVDEVEFVSQLKSVPVLAQCVAIEEVIRAAYEKIGSAGSSFRAGGGTQSASIEFDMIATEKLVETLEKEGQDQHKDDERQIEQSDNSLVRLINNMIIEAHKDGVSDIHIESYPGRYKIKIRFRKDGLLHTHLELPHTYRNALIARIKIMCDLDISERRKPQDGKINFARFSPQHRIELRVATIPTNNGLEDVVMRILASAKPIPVDKLGLSTANLEALKVAMERPYGLVLCVGPTGSGKTTTLHSALSYINVPERKIWTAEDPVEITQPGLRQVQVNPKIDWTFAKALRAFLRADPDVIMVGEIRDQETAQMAVEASLTGHLVLSTLHTNSAPETVTRLLDMGMDPFNFADSLLAVLAQRLVRRLCSHCRITQPAREDQVEELLHDYLHAAPKGAPGFERDTVLRGWIERFGHDGKLMAHHSPGCEHCSHTGHKGRAGLHELLVVSRELRHMIQTGARAEQLQHTAMLEGMRTLRQDGIEKVLQGIASIEEVRATSNV